MSVHPWMDLPALMTRLDDCLSAAVPRAQARYGVGLGADPYRGLYIGDELVQRLIEQPVDGASLGDAAASDWPELRPALGVEPLDPFETAVAVLALGPEIDVKYERIYGYLQDDVNARRPRVALALDLFCSDLQSRLSARDRFSADATLRRDRIVVLGGAEDAPLLARSIRLDSQLVRHLTGGTGIDERVAGRCEVLVPDPSDVPVPLDQATRDRVAELVTRVRDGRTARVVMCGADTQMLADLARHVAGELEIPMLRVVDVVGLEAFLPILAAEARLLEYAVLLPLPIEFGSPPYGVLEMLDSAGPLVIVTSQAPCSRFEGFGFEVVTIAAPTAAVRREWWARYAHGLAESDIDRLAARYQLSATQIATAARAALADGAADIDGFAAAARRQSARALDSLATRVPAIATWDALVLQQPAIDGLHELCDRVTHRHTVLRQWGLDKRTNGRLGVNALFAGPSGTGKTMAAQVVAHELGLELFAIDLSGVVSKYIGETEKNLDAIFRAAEGTDAVLLFDEADALFGKRSEVRDSHDRYANLEVSYLLQRMEAHDGVAILATNLRQNLDEAFLRRLAFTIRFPFPEEAERRRIWATIWPPSVPLDVDIDVNLLASRYKFSGGNIRNVAVGAAFLAAAAGRSVSLADVFAAIDREYDKLGGGAALAPSRLVATPG